MITIKIANQAGSWMFISKFSNFFKPNYNHYGKLSLNKKQKNRIQRQEPKHKKPKQDIKTIYLKEHQHKTSKISKSN